VDVYQVNIREALKELIMAYQAIRKDQSDVNDDKESKALARDTMLLRVLATVPLLPIVQDTALNIMLQKHR
jgi:hypothetical protein